MVKNRGIIHVLNWLLVMLFTSIGIGLSTEATDALISDPYWWLIFPTSFIVTFGMTGFEMWVYCTRTLDTPLLKMTKESVSVPERQLTHKYSMEPQQPVKIDNKNFTRQWRRSFIKGGNGKK